MEQFEGYIGIRIGEYQLVKDTVFALLLVLFVTFSLIFNSHFRLFAKMFKNVLQVKQRQSLFEITLGNTKGNENLFHFFMIFQTLFLCALFFYCIGVYNFDLPRYNILHILTTIGGIFLIITFFYFFKQSIYLLFGWTFMVKEQRRLWHDSYLANIQLWGVLLYVPMILICFAEINLTISFSLFLFLYILCRFVIFYKSIRIFQIKKDGALLFFLYLCAQEIIPIFLLYKGVEILYNFIELSTLWR